MTRKRSRPRYIPSFDCSDQISIAVTTRFRLALANSQNSRNNQVRAGVLTNFKSWSDPVQYHTYSKRKVKLGRKIAIVPLQAMLDQGGKVGQAYADEVDAVVKYDLIGRDSIPIKYKCAT